MRIYYVANARMPSEKAHGIQIAKMCEAFILAGADLELVLPARAGESDRGYGGSLKEFYGLKVEIPVRRLSVLNLGFIMSSISFMFAYFFYLRGKKDAVVYTIDMDNFSFSFIRFLGIPYFLEIHNTKKNTIFWNIFFRKIKGIVVINNNVKNSLTENFNLDSKKMLVWPNAIDLEKYSQDISKEDARSKLNLPQDKKIAIYIGRNITWKRMEILSEAGKLLSGEIIHSVTDRPYQEMPMWLHAADLLLVVGTKKNEYSYRYTSPMKIFDYMASERPILASNTPANREILSENEAYFYEPDNAHDLSDKIKHLMTNLKDTKLKVDNARQKVEKYTWSKRASDILEFMKNK